MSRILRYVYESDGSTEQVGLFERQMISPSEVIVFKDYNQVSLVLDLVCIRTVGFLRDNFKYNNREMLYET